MVDVKTAFLNADMDTCESSQLLLIAPPGLFVEKGLLKKGVMYVPEKAIYGLRRSPKLWGMHRDRILQELEVDLELEDGTQKCLHLEALASKQNLWQVRFKGEEELRGLLMTYVDDIFVVGSPPIAQALIAKIQTTWKTSPPETVGVEGVKFLGMEVVRKKGDQGLDEWWITQRSYVTDLLASDEAAWKVKKVPISKDQSLMAKDEGLTSPEAVRSSQKVVGELLWLVTRSRPDLMYSVSRMAQEFSAAPRLYKKQEHKPKPICGPQKTKGCATRKKKKKKTKSFTSTPTPASLHMVKSHTAAPSFWQVEVPCSGEQESRPP